MRRLELILYGASGDLAWRKLAPAIAEALARGTWRCPVRLIGLGRRPMADAELEARLTRALSPELRAAWQGHDLAVRYVQGDEGAASEALRPVLSADPEAGRIYYLATPPSAFGPIAEGLAAAGLLGPAAPGAFARLVVEKPFGTSEATARALNRTLAAALPEADLYRIDHFLGKEAAQNLLAFRGANAILEPVWNRLYVDSVQISASETLGVEARGAYYERAGALRDMLQNHLMQLLALTALELPARWEPEGLRDERVRLLRAIRPLPNRDLARHAARGQYAASGGHVGYRAEPGVDPASRTETYAALRLLVDNARWAGVPFYLRSGKRMASDRTEIAIRFKPAAHVPFAASAAYAPNKLVLTMAPESDLTLHLWGKRPGQGMALAHLALSGCAPGPEGRPAPSAYTQLLGEVLEGDQTFFIRADEAEAAWRVVDPVLAAWEAEGAPEPYAAGASSFPAADALLAQDGHRWRDLP